MAAATHRDQGQRRADDRAGGAGLNPAPVPRRLELHRAAAASRSARPGPAATPSHAAQVTAALDCPALTGMSCRDLAALAAALQIPFNAAREQRLYAGRGGPRRVPGWAATPYRGTLGPAAGCSPPYSPSACQYPSACSPPSSASTRAPSATPSRSPAGCSPAAASPSSPHRPGSAPLPTSATTPATPESTSPPPPSQRIILLRLQDHRDVASPWLIRVRLGGLDAPARGA